MNKSPPSIDKTTKVVWFSRHLPTKRQLQAITALYPNHSLHIDTKPFDGADDVVARYRAMHADEMVCVAPLTVIRELVKRGLKPLHAQMEQCSEASAETSSNGRHYRFVRFTRITDVQVIEEELTLQPQQ